MYEAFFAALLLLCTGLMLGSWLSLPEASFENIADLVQALSGSIGAYIAYKALSTWRQQLVGGAEFEVARKLAKSSYMVKCALEICRSPNIWDYEFPEKFNMLSAVPAEKAGAYAYVYGNRLSAVWSALDEFDAATLEAESIWGGEIRKPTDELRKIVQKVNLAIGEYIEDVKQHGFLKREDRKNIRSIIAASAKDQDNLVNQELQAAVKAIEAMLKPHLRR